ncbi:hypothetical protein [Amycolatopsis sp. NPDC051102]|uniref:hypothetical protein n=1 Tax=Amycolatopsis sp. NPDC051102 TaxID=3155163 RepID=UPI00341A3488
MTGLPEKPDALILGSAGTLFIRQASNRGYQVWNLAIQPPSRGNRELPRSLGEVSAVSGDGQTLITRDGSGVSDRRYYLWDARDIFHPRQLTQLPVAPGGNRPQFSGDGNLVVFSSFNTVQLIDISDRNVSRAIATLTTHDFPKSVVLGENRHWLILVDINNRVNLWDIDVETVVQRVSPNSR